MEQVLRILKQLMATGGMLGGIPKPVKMAMLYFTAIVGVMVIFKVNKNLDPGIKTFLIIAIVVASVTLSIGMIQLPPVMVSAPFKILLFVLVDGWNLVVGSLLKSFYT